MQLRHSILSSEEIPRNASDEELVTYVNPSPVELNSSVEDPTDDKAMLQKFANIQTNTIPSAKEDCADSSEEFPAGFESGEGAYASSQSLLEETKK